MELRAKFLTLVMGGSLALFAGCAGNTANYSSTTDTTEDGVSLPPSGEQPVVLPDNKQAVVLPDAEAAKPEADPGKLAAAAPLVAPVTTVEKKDTGNFKYKVKPGQTLMQVAYDVYGDIQQWRHVMELNKEKVSDPTALKRGMNLVVDQDPKEGQFTPEGSPFKIRQGDTLGLISDDVYGTQAKWKRLWDNNKRLIKNPNRIYAGFYLYYLFSEEDRTEKERYKGIQRPALLQQSPRDVSSVSAPAAAQ